MKQKRWIICLLVLSRRVHSIFVLRCFNDCVAMTFLYASILALLHYKNTWSTILLTLAISVKMNVLLFLPGFLMIWSMSDGILKAVWNLILIVMTQGLIGLPFLKHNWKTYLGKAFELDRQFTFKWSVNWKFLGEELALNPTFAKILLGLHLSLLVYFLFNKWVKIGSMFRDLRLWPSLNAPFKKVSPEFMLNSLFICNFIGIVFSRSLHY